ncbi:MAG: carboxypeptidase-like regulatory domain-containing protein [Gemmatimonadetes bacterium]|nr:carboxypeptidase-like regulatory domain-containing protein [Gemmatimonadota bacterium]
MTADINREPWDVALGTILAARGLVASRGDDGVIHVDRRAARVGTVTGEVTHAQSGVPVPAAQVFISDLRLGGLSQRNGRYLLQNVPAGTHTLSVTRMGYRTVEAQITVRGGQTIEQGFSIAEEALQLDPIIVTGTVGGTTRRSIGNAVSVVDPAAIPAPVTSMQQVLAEWALGNRPLIYVDGMLVRNPFSHPADLENLDPDDVESVEVLSPAAALARYGVRAAAGLVQIRTKR